MKEIFQIATIVSAALVANIANSAGDLPEGVSGGSAIGAGGPPPSANACEVHGMPNINVRPIRYLLLKNDLDKAIVLKSFQYSNAKKGAERIKHSALYNSDGNNVLARRLEVGDSVLIGTTGGNCRYIYNFSIEYSYEPSHFAPSTQEVGKLPIRTLGLPCQSKYYKEVKHIYRKRHKTLGVGGNPAPVCFLLLRS